MADADLDVGVDERLADLREVVTARLAWTPEQRQQEVREWAAFDVDAAAWWAEDEAELAELLRSS